jgi:hypothetical protein
MELSSLERLPLWIGGRAVAPATTRYGEVTNPATGEVVRHVPLANAADVVRCRWPRPRCPRGAARRRCAARASS